MNKKLYLALIGAAIVSLAVASVSARASPSTPLYAVRMEQASSEMNFLPTAVTSYNFATENGYTLNCSAQGYHGNTVLLETEITCEGDPTCQSTCPQTWLHTCMETCSNTCSTCAPECACQP